MTVLASLVGAMTVGSAVLLVLEPGPVRSIGGLSLSSVQGRTSPASAVSFAADAPVAPERWVTILIHDGEEPNEVAQFAGLGSGSAAGVDRSGYHFVIGNGRGIPDGRIEIGALWERQLPGRFSIGTRAELPASGAIGIRVVGDGDHHAFTDKQMRSLVWLVQSLQAQYGIPAERVVVESGTAGGARIGRLFPLAWFRQQILTFAVP